jgi:molybdate transport system substrate-binding protein
VHSKSTRTVLNRLTKLTLGLGAWGLGAGFGAWDAARPASPTRAEEVHVAAAVSLTEALQEIAAAFEREQGIRVTLNLAASNVLSRQIVAGARADVFISADAIQMAAVEREGLVRRSVDLLTNHLAVLVPAGSKVSLATPSDLLRPEIRRIAIGDPAGVPAGVYAKRYLEQAGVWTRLESKIVPAGSVRAALAALESENVDVAIVYRSDARIARNARFAYPSPPEPVALYPAALLSPSPAAERFFTYLRSRHADLVFQRHGFAVPDRRPERTPRPGEPA